MATIGTFKKSGGQEFTGEIVTLSVQAKGVRIIPDPRATGENAPSHRVLNAHDLVPVSVIGRLAVSREQAGKGLGADLLSDALRRIAQASQSIGIAAVLVHGKDDAAKRFYLRCAEFIEYPEDSRTLFLPIETVIAGLG